MRLDYKNKQDLEKRKFGAGICVGGPVRDKLTRKSVWDLQSFSMCRPLVSGLAPSFVVGCNESP